MKQLAAAVISLATSLATSLTTGLALAGPLTPPPGAVSPTGKTTDQIEPRTAISASTIPGSSQSRFVISEPGSYYLAENIVLTTDRGGIFVDANNVTIDLSGFSLTSTNPASGDGVEAALGVEGLTVRNGTLSGWNSGIDARAVAGGVYENLIAIDNRGDGIGVGEQSTILRCVARMNGLFGIRGGDACTIKSCTAVSNTSTGVLVGAHCAISDTVVNLNGGTGIVAGFATSISGCVASNNSSNGISASGGNAIINSTAQSNGFNGFSVTRGASVTNCASRSNGQDGFSLGFSSKVSDSLAEFNEVNGFDLGSSTSITNCNAYANTEDGIEVGNDCRVAGNVCDSNRAWGILGAADTTIESNTVTDNGTTTGSIGGGIICSGGLIIRNTLAGNAVINIDTTGADFGPIVGQSGQITSTNPWANIVY